MAFRYTFRVLPDGLPSKPASRAKTLVRVARRLRGRAPHTLSYGGTKFTKENSTLAVLRRVRRILRRNDRVIVHSSRGPSIAVRKFKADLPSGSGARPADTVGTPAIDKIVGAVRAEFERRWTVRDMGIARRCTSLSSEHCRNNAWDVGTDMNLPAAETWRRVTRMGVWLMEQGQRHLATGGKEGLPVKSVIWMDKVWRRGVEGSRGPSHYGGVKHVSHAHVAGFPGFLPPGFA